MSASPSAPALRWTSGTESARMPAPRWLRGVDLRDSARTALRLLLEFQQCPADRPDVVLCASNLIEKFIQHAADIRSTKEKINRKLPPATVDNLTDDDIIVLRAFTLETPYALYKLLNAWLTSERRDDAVRAAVGPLTCRMLFAIAKLPLVDKGVGMRVVAVLAPALEALYSHYTAKMDAAAFPMSFWAFSSFTKKMDLIHLLVPPTMRRIVYKCDNLRGVSLEPFSEYDEEEILVPAPSMFNVTITTALLDTQTLVIGLNQIVSHQFSYVDLEDDTTSRWDAIKRELQFVRRYATGKCDNDWLQYVNPPITYHDAAQCLASLDDPHYKAVGLWALGRCSRPVRIAGILMDKRTLCVAALEHDSSLAWAFISLASTLTETEELVLQERKTNKVSLLIEALRHDPANFSAYNDLGNALPKGKMIRLADERMMTKFDLYKESLKFDPTNPYALYGLGNALEKGENVRLADGRSFSRVELYLEALKYNPCYSKGYNRLANTIARDDKVTLPDRRTMNKCELYVEALTHDRSNSYAYYGLAVALGERGERNVTLADRRKMDLRELFIEAIKHNPDYSRAYSRLADIVASEETVQPFGDGVGMDRKRLYIEAIRHDPFNEFAYRGLASCMAHGETVTLVDGPTMNRTAVLNVAEAFRPKAAPPS